jgi:hypothetical protein
MYISSADVKHLYFAYNSNISVYTAKYTQDLQSGVAPLATSSVPTASFGKYGFLYRLTEPSRISSLALAIVNATAHPDGMAIYSRRTFKLQGTII